MNIIKTSIKAIILTMFLVSIVFFISLFKGIFLKDLKFDNIAIKHLFIKLDNKIVLKIDDLNIKSTKNKTQNRINFLKLKKTAQILNYFEEIEIKNLHLNNSNYNLSFKNNKLILKSNQIYLHSIVNPNKFYINIVLFKLPNYNTEIRNLLIEPVLKKHLIKFSSNFIINDKKAKLKAVIQNKKAIFNILVKNFVFEQTLKLKSDINATIKIDKKVSINAKLHNIKFKYKDYFLTANQANLKINNNKLKIKAPILTLKKPLDIVAKNITLTYLLNHHFLYAKTPIIKINLKEPTISTTLINNSITALDSNINFTSNIIKSESKEFNATSKNFILNYINTPTFSSNNLSFSFKKENLHLFSPLLTGSQNIISLPIIKGNFKKLPILLKKNMLLLKEKKITTQTAYINSIKLYNITFDLPSTTLTFYSNPTFNDKLKEIIKTFTKTKLPITQIKGKNYLFTSIQMLPLKIYSKATLKNALFKIEDINLSTQETNITLKDKNITFQSKNDNLNLKDINVSFDSNGSIDLNKQILLSNIKLNFHFQDLINLTDYKESIKMDLKSDILKAKNSHLILDLKEKYLIISSLKYLLRYTPLKNYIDDGIVYINFSDVLNIYSYFRLKLPVLFKHNNQIATPKTKIAIKNIPIQIFIYKDKTVIYNNFLNLTSKEHNLSIKLQNVDIDLFPLEKIFLKSDNNSSKKSDINVTLTTTNTNILYKNHKFLSQKAKLTYIDSKIKISSKYKHSSIYGYSRQGYFLLEGKNFSNEEFKGFLPKFNFFKSISVDFIFVKSPDNFYSGKVYIKHAVVDQLKTLNNVIAFINTIPSILSLSSPGFSSKGYKIKQGFINYLLYKNILYIKQAKIIGTNLDFYAKGYVDFNKNYLFIKITANMKMKIKKIPIIGKGLSYLLFGKDGGIDVKIIVKGDINNPQVEQDLGKEILLSPFELFKRAVTLPFNLF